MGGSIDVWVVDAATRWREETSEQLARIPGLRCSLALPSGTDAMQALRQVKAPDVVLMDHDAETAASLALVADLQRAAPATRVVIVSAARDDARVLEVLRAGAVGFLRKPTDVEHLVAAIRTVVAGGAPLDATVARRLLLLLQGRPVPDAAAHLTVREREIVRRLADGGSLKQVAASIGLSPHTVDTHVRSIYAKLGVRSKSAAVAKALRLGLA